MVHRKIIIIKWPHHHHSKQSTIDSETNIITEENDWYICWSEEKGDLYEMITEGHNWCICWWEKEVCPTIKVWGESPDRSSPNKVRACGFYIFRNMLLIFALAMANQSYFDEFLIWKMVVQYVHSKFSRQDSWRSSMNVVLFEITATVSSNQISRCQSPSWNWTLFQQSVWNCLK